MDYLDYDVLIVGCGLSGAVIAERYATLLNKKVLIIDKRNHIGGNCYDYIDKETGILLNKYGAHIFHTNSEIVWNYVNKFAEWVRWEHEVKSFVDNAYVPIPINVTTINKVCNENLQSASDMIDWLEQHKRSIPINNSEDVVLSVFGKNIYNKLFKNYTYKQWNKYPNELLPEVLERIPYNTSFDTRYFKDKYQALPKKGYTNFINNILNHHNITIKLNTDFETLDPITYKNKIIIYTGPIDAYFNNINLPKLEYRSINFEIKRFKNMNYYQPNSVINYPDLDVDYTRSVEYKHFLNQKSNDTIVVFEYPTDDGEPYYPVPDSKNKELYEYYRIISSRETHKRNIHFIGRLANYKYFNMDQAILNSIEYFNKYLI